MFETGKYWSLLIGDTGAGEEKIYYVPIFDSIMDAGTDIIPIDISEYSIMQVVDILSRFMPLGILKTLLIEVFTKPWVVDLVKTVLPLVMKLFVTKDPAVLKEIMDEILRPLLIDPIFKNIEKYQIMATDLAQVLLDNIDDNDLSNLSDIINQTLFSFMPYFRKVPNNWLGQTNELLNFDFMGELDGINQILEPITSIYERLGPIYEVAQLIVGGLAGILIDTISNILQLMQDELTARFIFPAINQLIKITFDPLQNLNSDVLYSLINIDEIIDNNQELITQINQSDDPFELLENNDIDLGISDEDIIQFLSSISNIIENGINVLLSDPNWLGYIILPILIPSYEFAKLFGIRSIIEMLSNPADYFNNSNDDNQSLLSLNQKTSTQDNLSWLLIGVFDTFFNFLNFLNQYLEYKDDDIPNLATIENKVVLHDYQLQLLDTVRNDLQGEGVAYLLGWSEFMVGIFEFFLLMNDDSIDLTETELKFRFVTRSTNMYKSLIELLQTFILHMYTPVDYRGSTLTTAIDAIWTTSYDLSDISKSISENQLLMDKLLKPLAKIGGHIAKLFLPIFGVISNLDGLQQIVLSYGLNTLFADLYQQMQLLEYFVNLNYFGLNTSLMEGGEFTIDFVVENIIGIPIMNYVFPDVPLALYVEIPIVLILYYVSGHFGQLFNFIENALFLLFSQDTFSQLNTITDKNPTILGKIVNFLTFFVTSVTTLFEMVWQYMIAIQSSIMYFYFKDTIPLDYEDWNGKDEVLKYDLIFGVIGQGLVYLSLGIVKVFKTLKLFKVFLDPARNSDEFYYGMGIVDIAENPLEASKIDGLDSFKQEGTIDILEAMLTSFKWSLVPGGLLNTIFINIGM